MTNARQFYLILALQASMFSPLYNLAPWSGSYVQEKQYDVGHNVAQEPISFYYGQVLIGGPFKAFGP